MLKNVKETCRRKTAKCKNVWFGKSRFRRGQSVCGWTFSNLDCPVSISTEISDPQVEPELKAISLSNVNSASACWFLHTKLNDKKMPMLFLIWGLLCQSFLSGHTKGLGPSKPDVQAVDGRLFGQMAQSYQLRGRQNFISKLRQWVTDRALWSRISTVQRALSVKTLLIARVAVYLGKR